MKESEKDFWSHFNSEHYKKVLLARDGRLEIRVNEEEKQKFIDKVGNVSEFINGIINHVNNR